MMRNIEVKTVRNSHPEPKATPLAGPERSEWMSVANKQVQHDRVGQTGRSMVEMLGVLAVMALLSIVGILGLRSALDSAKVNKIIQALSRRATVLAADKTFGTGFTDNASFGQDTDYTITCSDIETNVFSCTVQKVEQKVCQKILDLNWELPSLITPNTCAAASNNMTFLFGSTLAGEGAVCTKNEDCDTDCFRCDTKKHVCVSKCSASQKCARYALYATDLEYNKKVCCSDEKILDGYCCDSIDEREDGTKTCCMRYQAMCCAVGEFYSPNACYSCDTPEIRVEARGINTYAGYTAAFCPQRIRAGAKSYLVQNLKNPLASCPDQENNILIPDTIHAIGVRCGCPAEKPIQDLNGFCYSCSETPPVRVLIESTGADRCFLCNWGQGGGYCYKYSEGFIASPTYGEPGTPCADLDIASLVSKYQCESCPHTQWTGEGDTTGSCGCKEGYIYTLNDNGAGACEPEN